MCLQTYEHFTNVHHRATSEMLETISIVVTVISIIVTVIGMIITIIAMHHGANENENKRSNRDDQA